MNMIIGNPAGWWALLGVPAILLIHCLQSRARRFPSSTLFLLEHVAPESREGRVFERLRSSRQLWLQLLAVCLLTWLLVEPRWQRSDSFQRVVVVVDSSLSMRAFQSGLAPAVSRALHPLARAAATTEWRLLESDADAATLYVGNEVGVLLERLAAWLPSRGTHDPAEALRVARSLAGPDGTLIFVSDRELRRDPAGVYQLAIGRAFAQCGFAGMRVHAAPGGDDRWEVLVRNFSGVPADRTWRVVVDSQVVSKSRVSLPPGAARRLQGTFPPGADRIVLALEPDGFVVDDICPLQRPVPKPLRVSNAVDGSALDLAEKFLATLPAVAPVRRSQSPDLELLSYDPGVIPDTTGSRIAFPREVDFTVVDASGLIVSEEHPLTDGLTWQGLLCAPVGPMEVTDRDQVLLWQGTTPILMERRQGPHRHLVIGFDVVGSNADRTPAFVLLLHRFAESVREAKPAPAAGTVDCDSALAVAMPEATRPVDLEVEPAIGGDVRTRSLPQASAVRTPVTPSFFTIRQDGEVFFRGAATFADPRESDFTAAASFSNVEDRGNLLQREHSRPDALVPVWLACLLGAVLLSWHGPGRAA